MSRRLNLLFVLIGLAAIWQGLYAYAGDEALRGPIETIADTARLLGTTLFWTNFQETMRAFAMALGIAIFGGVTLGIWLGFHRTSGELFTPMLIGFASIPKVVLYPLVLLAFGVVVTAVGWFACPPAGVGTFEPSDYLQKWFVVSALGASIVGATGFVRAPAIDSLPFFNPDVEQTALPPVIADWRARVARCDALIVSSPEYAQAQLSETLRVMGRRIVGDACITLPLRGRTTTAAEISKDPEMAARVRQMFTALSVTGAY